MKHTRNKPIRGIIYDFIKNINYQLYSDEGSTVFYAVYTG